MATLRSAKKSANRKSKQVFRTNIRKPKRQVVKKFANFVGKVTFKVASRGMRRTSRRKGYRKGYKKKRRY